MMSNTYVEGTKVNTADSQVSIEINTFATLVWITRVAGLIEETFISDGDQVVRID